MSKAKIELPVNMERSEHDWGVRLVMRPFASDDAPFSQMEIEAEINTPRPGRAPTIAVRFTGAAVHNTLKITYAVIWANALQAVMSKAREVASSMKPKKAKS